jgi:hypothetical protein
MKKILATGLIITASFYGAKAQNTYTDNSSTFTNSPTFTSSPTFTTGPRDTFPMNNQLQNLQNDRNNMDKSLYPQNTIPKKDTLLKNQTKGAAKAKNK